jgi:hypothetical protein
MFEFATHEIILMQNVGMRGDPCEKMSGLPCQQAPASNLWMDSMHHPVVLQTSFSWVFDVPTTWGHQLVESGE